MLDAKLLLSSVTQSEAPPTEPLRAERLYEQAVLAITRSIQSGEFSPGTYLPGEAELAQRYGVGRLVVREALRILGAKGLLALGQGKAARVQPPPGPPCFCFWCGAPSRAGLGRGAGVGRG